MLLIHPKRLAEFPALDALPAYIVELDERGIIVAANKPWARFAIAKAFQGIALGIGCSYLRIVEAAFGDRRDEGRRASERVMDVLSGKLSFCELEYPWTSPEEKKWFRVVVSALNEGRVGGAILMYIDVTEHKLSEDALRAAEQRHRLVFDRNLAGIFRTTLDGRFLDCNDAFARIFGYSSREEVLAHKTSDFYFSPADREALLNRLKKEKVLTTFELHLRRKDGSPIWVLENVTFTEGEQGAPAVMEGTLIDITDRKRTLEALQESEDRFRRLFDEAPVAYHEIDTQGIVCRVNQAECRLLGFDSSQILGKYIWEFVAEEEREISREAIRQKVTGEQPLVPVQREYVRRDGTRLILEVHENLIRDQSGQIIGVRSAMLDVTERKWAEEALRASEGRYRLLFEQNLAGVYRATLGGHFLDCNESFARILGYSSSEELMSHRPLEVYPSPGDREAFIERLKVERALTNFESCLRRKDGGPVWVLENASLIEDVDGTPALVQGTLIDITERKQLEDQLRQSQKMEAVGRLAGGVAHDFNNLLTIISGYSQLLLERLSPGDRLRANVEEIRKAGERAASLTRQLLAFSRQQVISPQILDMNAVVASMEKMLTRLIGEDIELVTVQGPNLGGVKADPGQIEQVILNLAVNSRDAMPQGGKIILETANVELDEAYSRGHYSVRPGSYVMLAVSDTGIGMDAETMSHIFEPFFTTKEKGKGTGLGLAMVYGIVKQSGGCIWVYSEPGRGTTFKIYLPRVERPVQAAEPAKAGAELASGSETILLVEDEEAVRSLVRGVLESNGYAVLEASRPEEALDICERHKAPIQLMLTDVVMPQMSGRELADRLVAIHSETKILYMSGYTDNSIVRNGVLEEGIPFLEKPFTPEALTRKVREVLLAN